MDFRITIDATPLLLRSAGIKTYLYHWIRALLALVPRERIRLFPFLDEPGPLTHENSILPAWATWPRLGLLYFVNVPSNPAIDWLAAGTDLFHSTNQVRNPPRRTKLTATVHDMTCWLMPELHTPANVRADKLHAERVWRRATGLIAVSESTKTDLVRILGITPEKVRVIHPGVADAFFTVTGTAVEHVRERYSLRRPYVLFVGTIEPRKNIDTLLDAFAALPGSVRGDVELIIAGPAGWSARRTMERLRSGIPHVRYLGYVPENSLPALTAGATVFAYTSLYEGFGLPVAQALACGVPVVVSGVSSLPEVAVDAGLYVDPRSPTEIGSAMDRLLTGSALHRDLSQRARARGSHFRWDACARQSIDFFSELS